MLMLSAGNKGNVKANHKKKGFGESSILGESYHQVSKFIIDVCDMTFTQHVAEFLAHYFNGL